MRTVARRPTSVVIALVASLAAASAGSAQDAPVLRTRVTVDYVGAEGLYLTVGADQGAERGDTVAVYADEAAVAPLGRVVFTAVTSRRAVAAVVDASAPFDQGDVLYLGLAPIAGAPALAASARAAPPSPSGRGPGLTGVRISGRIALDLDARETRTAWTGDLFGETRRRFATPTTRLSLLAAGLPGGVTVRASVRASYRYDDLGPAPPPVSIRAYEVAAVRSFERIPAQIMLGRFTDPYEGYSAYWDGALLRFGRPSGLGVGVVAGFEPQLYNEGFSRSIPKATAFLDFTGGGASWRYDGDASFHVVRPSGGLERRFIGWSQRLSLGRLAVSQRLRADVRSDGRPSLTELRLRGTVDVGGPLRLRGSFSRTDGAGMLPLALGSFAPLPVRREVSAGLDLTGARGSLSIEGSRADRGTEQPGWSLYGNAGLRTRPVYILLSGRRWQRGDLTAWTAAPAVLFRLGSMEWQAGYRLYTTVNGDRAVTSHSTYAQLGLTLMRGTRATFRGERQWGPQLSGTRIRLGLWRSF